VIRFGHILVFALAISLGLLAGCGPKPEGGTDNRGGKGPVTVHLAYFPNVTHGVALVGAGRGIFSGAFGSDAKVEEQTFNAGPAEIEALFADQVDIGYVGPGPAINGFLKSNGKALQIIAGAASGGAALVVRSDSGIADIKGLAGKRVAVPQTGGTQDISLRHSLQTAGLASTDKNGTVTILPTPNPDTLTLFQKKEVDAAWVPEPWVARLVKEGNGKILTDERDLWPNKSFASTVVVARRQFLKDHPDLVSKFLEAHVQAVEWIRQNPDEARKVMGDQIKKATSKAIPEDILKDSLSRTEFTYDPLKETVLTFADSAKALGYQKVDRSALGDLFALKPLNDALQKAKKPAIP
jgi:NitT/TauT family transport system substrate-binding protein